MAVNPHTASLEDNPEWRRRRGCSYNSWLGQVDQSLKELGMGREDAWRLARGDCQKWRK